MESNRNRELSWAERPFGELVRLTWPITISSLSYSTMTLVDTLIVGRLGAGPLAGVGLAGVSAFTLLIFAFGLMRGAKTLVAQAWGAGRREDVGAYRGAALVTALAVGLCVAGLGQLVARVLERLAAGDGAGEAARTYLSVRILGAPLALSYVALRAVRYGAGDARTPMGATVVANVTNIVLAYTFVHALGLGVRGAATATVIAHGVELGVLCLAQQREGWGVRRARWEHLAALWRMGLPTGIQFALEIGAFALLSAMISALSEVQMAAHQIALQVVHFSVLPALAVAESGGVLAGQAVGAGRQELVNRVARLALGTTVVWNGACTLALGVGARPIVAAFTEDPALAQAAMGLLHVAMLFLVIDGANEVARAALRGTGDVRFPAAVGMATAWACTPPLTWLLGYKLGLGAAGGWLGITAELVVGASILWWRLERRQWTAAAPAYSTVSA